MVEQMQARISADVPAVSEAVSGREELGQQSKSTATSLLLPLFL